MIMLVTLQWPWWGGGCTSWWPGWLMLLTYLVGSSSGLSPNQHHAIIRISDGLSLSTPLCTNFSEIWIKIQQFSFNKMNLKMFATWWKFCLGVSVLVNKIMVTERTGADSVSVLSHIWKINSSCYWSLTCRDQVILVELGEYHGC